MWHLVFRLISGTNSFAVHAAKNERVIHYNELAENKASYSLQKWTFTQKPAVGTDPD